MIAKGKLKNYGFSFSGSKQTIFTLNLYSHYIFNQP